MEKKELTRENVYDALKKAGDRGISFSELVDIFHEPISDTDELSSLLLGLRIDTWVVNTGGLGPAMYMARRELGGETEPQPTINDEIDTSEGVNEVLDDLE